MIITDILFFRPDLYPSGTLWKLETKLVINVKPSVRPLIAEGVRQSVSAYMWAFEERRTLDDDVWLWTEWMWRPP